MNNPHTHLHIYSHVIYYYIKKTDDVNNLNNYLTNIVFNGYDYLKLLPRFDFLFNQLRVIARGYIHLQHKCI